MRHVAVCLFLLLVAVQAQQSSSQKAETSQSNSDQRHQIHSREIKHGIPDQIPQQLATTSGDVYLHTAVSPPLTIHVLDSFGSLVSLACESDLVVQGKIRNGKSHPTVDQGYIYTDWDLAVEHRLKDNPRSPVGPGQTITITRAGGTLTINGRHVYAIDSDSNQFSSGDEVLLYLHYLPETDTYSLRRPNGFILSGSQIVNLDKSGFIQSATMHTNDLIDLARKAANERCQTGGPK